jgi:hypothetical protein
MNDEVTSTLAALWASLNTDSLCPDGFRHGIARETIARMKNRA